MNRTRTRAATDPQGLFETLEPRQLLAILVTNLNDAGAGSLRQAIADANAVGGAEVINFDSSLNGTITLSSVLEITDDLTINGPGRDKLTLNGNDLTRIFDIDSATTVGISGLALEDGAANGAGAILNTGILTLEDCVLSSNRTTAISGGGAIFNSDTLTITGCNFSDNASLGWGGAIDNAGNLSISNSVLSANHADMDGGGILSNSLGSFVLLNSTLSGNSAGTDGGAIWVAGLFDMSGCTLSGNQADARGGALFGGGSGGVRVVVNSTISGNTAGEFGGGIFNLSSNILNIDNSTITGNSAATNGAGIHSNGATRIRSSIICGNGSTDFTGSATLGAASVSNLMGSSAGGLVDGVNGNMIVINPGLGTLANNGGLTFTHALLPDSPAIGGGANPGSLTFDQRGTGFPRVADGAVDIGAVEFTALPTIGGLTPSATTIVRGEPLTLTANNVEAGGATITQVNFYLDYNNDGEADDDELIGVDASGGNGYRRVLDSTLELPTGEVRFFAIAFAQGGGQSAPATTVVNISNFEPTLGTLLTSHEEFEQGQSGFTLSAVDPEDVDGNIAVVRFYADLNNDGVAQSNEQIGADLDGSNGFDYTVDPGQSLELPLGEITFLSVAFDNDGGSSAPTSAVATFVYSIHAGAGRTVVGTADAANAPRVATINADGHLILFEDGWIVGDLNVLTGAPDIIDDAVAYVDPKDALLYVAAPSSEGLLLFTRSSAGTWTVRNLSTETGASESPTHGLTTFTSTQGLVGVSGITESGRIVLFGQTLEQAPGGGPAFNFLDISSDLESQGMTTPRLETLISYVPTWNSWHLAGIDDEGRIQSVWINKTIEGFTKWRTDDLTATTGAPALTGQLAVTLTSWGGINLTGLNADGHLLTTWWVPEFGGDWRNNNLTEQFGGAPFIAGNISGYTTPWGGLNYVGLNEEGRVIVYWWAPEAVDWSVTPLLPDTVPTAEMPTGKLTSSASAGGTLNVYGATDQGDVVRLAWERERPEVGWTAENLSELAARQ